MTGCKSCSHWSLRRNRDMALLGLAVCDLGATYTYFPPQHTCDKHASATKEIQQARVKWLRRKTPEKAVAHHASHEEARQWWQED